MKTENKRKRSPILSFTVLTVIVLGFFFAFNEWKRSTSPVHQPTPTSNDFVFGRVESKNPSDFIKTDTAKMKSVFENGSISFAFDPSRFEVSTFESKDAPSGSGVKMEKIIVQNRSGDYLLEIQLKLDGIGGGCPDFPKGYNLSQMKLSGQNITKAKFINQKEKSEVWPIGNIFLVTQDQVNGKLMWNCPNVAGLESPKNGSSSIVYHLDKLTLNSSEYKNAEKSLDEIVSSISGFW